jgi:hypothetical protein
MPKTKISEFSATPANNTDIDSINIAEGCAPSGINDAIRELMAQLKDWQSGTSNDPYVVGSSGSLTLNQGTANGVAYLNGSKVVTSGSALVFDSNNRLSVNQSSSLFGAQLEVTGGALGQAIGIHGRASDGTGNLVFGANGASTEYARIQSDNTSSLQFGVGSSGTEQMRLTSTGLGIGTSSPASKLQISASSGGDTSGLRITRTDTGGGDWKIWSTSNANGEGGGKLIFGTASNYMTLDGSGNLGLGTTSPTEKLHVAGAFRVTGAQTTAGTGVYLDYSSGIGSVNVYGPDNSTQGIWRVYTATANGGTGSEKARITSGGDLLVGTTSASGTDADNRIIAIYGAGSANRAQLRLINSNTGTSGSDGTSLSVGSDLNLYITQYESAGIVFETGGANQRAQIDSSGNLLIGTTSLGNTHAYFEVSTVDRRILNLGSSTTASAGVLQFRNPNGVVGVVATSGSSTSYLTSSDYRLKENITPMTGALSIVSQLKPVTYKWKSDGLNGQGFIAHELQAIVPDCVTGEKDAVDDEGNPKYQGIDTSFLVATLTAAIQEQQAIIESLKARLDAANL